jgi:2-polyprenyl-3-methyl-5-hydroxy-6-metoxy-1,4-benzoquinol methylase
MALRKGFRMDCDIVVLSPDLSAGVQGEADALALMTTIISELDRSITPHQYWSTGISEAPYQYESILGDIPPGARVLDIGVGFGQSSVYLAERGYEVVAVEPAIALCRVMRDAAARHNLNILVVQGVAEHLARNQHKD